MGRIVIACYRPKPGHEEDVRTLVRGHLPILRSQGLVTDRVSIVMEAEDGTVIEIFEWASPEAIHAAHTNPVVLEMWESFAEVCEYAPVADVPEAENLFSEFTPLD